MFLGGCWKRGVLYCCNFFPLSPLSFVLTFYVGFLNATSFGYPLTSPFSAAASRLAEFALVVILLPIELTGGLHLEVIINKDSGGKTVYSFCVCGVLSPLDKHFISHIVVCLYSETDQCHYPLFKIHNFRFMCFINILEFLQVRLRINKNSGLVSIQQNE